MIVSHSHKLVYLAPPKTGSVSIKQCLMREPFNAVVIGDHAHHDVQWIPKLKDYFYFMTVRHPYPRMYSLWRMACNHRTLYLRNSKRWAFGRVWGIWFAEREPTFEEFLWQKVKGGPEVRHFRKVWRCSWGLEQLPKNLPVTVVHQERYYQGLQNVPALVPHIEQIGHANSNLDRKKTHWSEAVTQACADRIRKLWGEDFTRFGYTRDLKKAKRNLP